MTADRDRARQELADALREWSWEQGHEELPRTPGEIADALLPVLDAHARRYAADKIEKACDEWNGTDVRNFRDLAAQLRQEGG